MTETSDHEEHFWELAEPFLVQAAVTRSTMMGRPCLRTSGQFFASFDRRTGDLLVKLPEPRVDALVAACKAPAFSPVGRRLRPWAAIPPTRRTAWSGLLHDPKTVDGVPVIAEIDNPTTAAALRLAFPERLTIVEPRSFIARTTAQSSRAPGVALASNRLDNASRVAKPSRTIASGTVSSLRPWLRSA